MVKPALAQHKQQNWKSKHSATWQNNHASRRQHHLRMTASQQQLLSQAAEVEDISQQKLLESIIWPALTERYGE